MSVVSEEAENICRIRGEEGKAMASFQAFLIVDEKIALVEPGPSAFIPEVQAGMQQLGFPTDSLSYIFPTHIHMDHAGGTGLLSQLAPHAKVIVQESSARNLLSPDKLIEGARQAYGEDFENIYGPILPVAEGRLITVQYEKAIMLGKREVSIFHTPGHAPHHLCFYDSQSRGLFSGESLGVRFPWGELVLPPAFSPRFDPQIALESIARLKKLDPEIIFYGHLVVSREPDRCFKLAEDSINVCGDIILNAMKKKGDREQIAGILEESLGIRAYMATLPAAWVRKIHDLIQWTLKQNVIAYGNYFMDRKML